MAVENENDGENENKNGGADELWANLDGDQERERWRERE